jgi:hypothetical protein
MAAPGLRRPLVVTDLPMTVDIDAQISSLVDVPHSMHAFERVSLADFDSTVAFRAGAQMCARFAPNDRLILLGGQVVRAFDLDVPPYEQTRRQGRWYLHIPMPIVPEPAARALDLMLAAAPGREPRCGFG